MAGKIQVPSVNSEKYSPDSCLLTRIWFIKKIKQKCKAKICCRIAMIPTLFVYCSSNRQALGVLFFDQRRKTQKFGYFCHFGTFLFFSFHSRFVMYMFSLLLQFHACKNICLSCQQKHLPFVSSKTVCVFTLPSDTSATQ